MLAFGSRILGMYVDWLWFGEVGFRGVFWTRIWAQLLLGLAGFVLFFVIIWANAELARRLAPDFRADVDGTLLEPRSPAVRSWVGIGAAVVCAVVAFIAAVSASGSWQRVLLYLNQASWGEKDPIFGRDISFYVFSVPFWQGVLSFVLAALIVSLMLAAIVHLIMGGIEHQAEAGQGCAGRRRRGDRSPFARAQQAAPQLPQIDLKLGGRAVAHLSALLAAIFVAVGDRPAVQGLEPAVLDGRRRVRRRLHRRAHPPAADLRDHGASPCVLAAALVWNVWRRRQWWPVAIAVWVVALIVLRGVVPAVYQSLIVNPNQLSKEKQYISYNLGLHQAGLRR